VTQSELRWQSKLVLLLVLPGVGAHVLLEAHWWSVESAPVAIWTLGLAAVFGLVTFKVRAATPWAALTGAAILASVMFATTYFPYLPWRTALAPVLTVIAISFITTRLGRAKKERLGMAESKRGRASSQVAANLGVAAIASSEFFQSWLMDSHGFTNNTATPMPLFTVALAALAEAAADTASSEFGQVFGGTPRMITTLRKAEPGTDGAITIAGTLAGVTAAALVAAAGTYALSGDRTMFWLSCAGGVFGLLFDSLLGATFENAGWLNNDAVNFISTASAAVFAVVFLATLRPPPPVPPPHLILH
jgi:Predicted membrane protein